MVIIMLNLKFLIILLFLILMVNSQQQQQQQQQKQQQQVDATPTMLTQDKFNDFLNEAAIGTFVMYYAPWCGHCKRLQATWNQLAEKFNHLNNILIAKVDCTVETELCSKQDILAYPTFIFYRKGDSLGERYEGERSLDVMESYILTMSYLKDENIIERITLPSYTEPDPASSAVNILSNENFRNFISDGFHFVKFYAPWCGHCQRMAPIFEELAVKYVNSRVKISKVDCTLQSAVCHDESIRAYPTLLFYYNGKRIENYNDQRTLEKFSAYIDQMVQRMEAAAYDADPETATVTVDYNNNQQPLEDEVITLTEISGQVIELTSKNINLALSKPGLLFIKFYAPWCGHCRKMEQTWIDLAKHYEGSDKVRIAECDCTNNQEACMNHNVNSYPTLVMFKDGREHKHFNTGRSLNNFINFIESISKDEL